MGEKNQKLEEQRKNKITAQVVKGLYKGKQIDVDMGVNGINTKVLVNGEPIKEVVTRIVIDIQPGAKITTMKMELVKTE